MKDADTTHHPPASAPLGSPGARIRLEPAGQRMRVQLGGTDLADSRAAVLLLENGYDAVAYFPREDVRMDLLEARDHATHCPWKGDACYWSRSGEDAYIAWGYPDPIEGGPDLRGYVAFYRDRVDALIEGD